MSRSSHTSKKTGRRGHWHCSCCEGATVERRAAKAPTVDEQLCRCVDGEDYWDICPVHTPPEWGSDHGISACNCDRCRDDRADLIGSTPLTVPLAAFIPCDPWCPYCERDRQKAEARAADQADIDEGRKTAEQVARENCVLPIGKIRWDLCKRLA